MKKVIALSIGLAFSVGSIAQEQVKSISMMEKTQSIVKDIVNFAKNKNGTPTPVEVNTPEAVKGDAKKNEVHVEAVKTETSKIEVKEAALKVEPQKVEVKPVVVSPQIESKPVAVNPPAEIKPVAKKAKVVKKKIKKAVKPAPKPILEKPAVPVAPVEQKAVLLQADYYYIPKQASLEQFALFAKPITYDDVELIINSKDETKHINLNRNIHDNTNVNENIIVSLVDKRINKPLDNVYLTNQKINVLNLSTDLSKKEALEITYNEAESQKVSFENKDNCRAIFVEYKLNNQNASKSVVKFVDNNGNLVNTMPASCNENIPDSKDTTFYTENGTIINVSFAQKQSVEKSLIIQAHFIKDGHEFNPANLKAYAVEKNFSTSYTLNSKASPNGPFFGLNLSQNVAPGAYYILIGHEYGKKSEWVKSSISIQ